MSDQRAKDLIEEGDRLFSKRVTLMSLWQQIADHFYCERADFTVKRIIGDTWADMLTTSYPLMVRRDLGNALGMMLRPKTKDWFKMSIAREDRLDDAGRAWLELKTKVQRRAMYDRASLFARATKEADHDYAAFGQAVISVELNRLRDTLLYRCWHLRDVAWCENAEGKIDTVHRKWKLYAKDAVNLFPKTVSEKLREVARKTPYEEVELRHVVKYSADYEGARKIRQPFTSIYIEMTDNAILEESGAFNTIYVIPRWQTVSGSQYSYSPATTAALPDGRLLQAITLTLLEAGEMATRPPLIATKDAIRSDIQFFAGGITWADAQYDERLGEVLRPVVEDRGGIPVGEQMDSTIREALKSAFYLDKLNLPGVGTNKQMTAFEVGQMVQEHVRQVLPLFEPTEQDYNGQLCEFTFDQLLHGGAFGPLQEIPPSIRGQDVQFKFESPITDTIGALKANKLVQTVQMVEQVAALDPTVKNIPNYLQMVRDAMRGIGVEESWTNTEEQVAQEAAALKQQAQQAQVLDAVTKGSVVASNLGNAAKGFAAGAPQGQAA